MNRFFCPGVGFRGLTVIPVAKGQGRVRAPVGKASLHGAIRGRLSVLEAQGIQSSGLIAAVPGRKYRAGVHRHGEQGLGQIQLGLGVIGPRIRGGGRIGNPGLHRLAPFHWGRARARIRHILEGSGPTGRVQTVRGVS